METLANREGAVARGEDSGREASMYAITISCRSNDGQAKKICTNERGGYETSIAGAADGGPDEALKTGALSDAHPPNDADPTSTRAPSHSKREAPL